MATRTVTVRLVADINQYTRSMRQAANNTSRLAGVGAKVGTAMVTGFAIAAAAAAKFDKALSNVRAVTGASATQMKQLRAAALEAGKTTSFTATQAADAEAELARAGISVADITGGALKGSLALAASGQMDLADSAVIAAQTMNTFGLKGKDVTHIADVLSAAANKSAADMHGLGMSLRQGGLLANQTGLSLEDTVGTLAAFADHALIGSDAGTSLKVMLQRLTPQSVEARNMMARLGFTAYDSQGKFVGLTKLAGNLQTSFKNLTPEARNAAFATIFGSDAVRSASILYELGASGIQKYVKSVDDQGAASRMASIQTDNLVGDLQRLRGAIEVALIEGGSSANGALRGMVQWVTKLVNAYNGLPPELQHAVTLLTGFGGAASLAAAGVLLLIPRIAATRTALTQLGITAARTRAVMMGLGRLSIVVAGLTAVSFGIKKLEDQFRDAPPNVTKMGNALLNFAKTGKAAGELTKTFGKDLDGFGDAVARLAHPSVLNRIGDSLYTITHIGNDSAALDDARDKLNSVDEALKQLVEGGAPDVAAQAFNKMAKEAEAQGTSTEKLRTLLPGYAEALTAADTQQQLSADSQKELASQVGLTADEMQDQRTEAEKLSDALKGLNGNAISTAEGEIQFRQSLADLSKAVKDNGHSLDVSTQKGREVKGAFLDAAKAAMDHAQAVAEQKNSQEAGQAVLERDIGLLKKQMTAAGFSSDAIDSLTAAYLKLPGGVATSITTPGSEKAAGELERLKTKLAGVPTGKSITVKAPTGAAIQALKDVGFKVRTLPNGKVTISVPTSGPKAALSALQRAINAMHGKTITMITENRTVYTGKGGRGANAQADGSVLSFYADGAHVAQIAPAGAWRVWAEPETGGEAYIPLAASKRPRSRQIAAQTVAMLGGSVQWFAGGGIPGFTYTPTGQAVLGGTSDAQERYDKGVENLKKAWDDLNKALADSKKKASDLRAAESNLSKVRRGHHTAAQLRSAQERVDKARSAKRSADAKVSTERRDVYSADAALGLKKGAKPLTAFSLTAYEAQLNKSVATTQKWRASLEKIGARGGAELKAMLEGMGEDGYNLVNSLAKASDKQFKSIVAKLQQTGQLAKATLADFTKQLGASTKENQQFATDLQKLASQGFGDLAQALAAQGDSNAMALAHEAAGNSKSAASAQAGVKSAQATLTGDDLANSLTLLSTLRGGTGRGFADLIAAGLDVATIRALVPKMTAQIKSLPAANRDTFIRQWVAQGGAAMASGGILSRPTMVLGGEAGVSESWIPWNNSARSRALLARTASAMGYRLTPAARYGGGRATAADVAREVTKHVEINLYGAKQTSAEQAMDIARHMT
ncbi:phage tail tape measure protein, partial [Streptomyces sp. NPDC003857]